MTIKYTHVEDFTPAFRATFINAVKPNTYDEDKPVYDLRALWPNLGGGDYSNLQWFYDALNNCAKINNLLNADGTIQCETPNFNDGNGPKCFTKETKEQYEGHLNHWWMKFKCSVDDGEPVPFGIVDMQGERVEAKDLYPGIWLQACLRIFPFHHEKHGLKMIMRVEHLRVVAHDKPFTSVGGHVSTTKVFENVGDITGVPSHLQANQGPGGAPQVNQGPGGAPQVNQGPGGAPQVNQGNMAPTADAHVAGFSGDAPPPQMGANAQGFDYQQWKDTGRTDDQLRAEGIIL